MVINAVQLKPISITPKSYVTFSLHAHGIGCSGLEMNRFLVLQDFHPRIHISDSDFMSITKCGYLLSTLAPPGLILSFCSWHVASAEAVQFFIVNLQRLRILRCRRAPRSCRIWTRHARAGDLQSQEKGTVTKLQKTNSTKIWMSPSI